MSLILQGIDLPKDGKTITVDIDSNGVAWVSNKGEWDKHQAIQIPKGHGRLIDADNIDYDEFWHRDGQGFTMAVCQKAEQIIEDGRQLMRQAIDEYEANTKTTAVYKPVLP